MSNTNAGTPPAQTTGATGAASTQQNGTTETNNSTIGVERIEQLEKTVNGMAAAIRRLTDGKQTTQTATSNDGQQGQQNQQAEKSLQDRLKIAESILEKGQRRMRDAAIQDAAREAGVPAERLRVFKTVIEADYGNKLKLTDDDSVVYEEFEGVETKPVATLISEFLKKPEGAIFRPAVQTPGGSGLRGGGKGGPGPGQKVITRQQLLSGNFKPEDLQGAVIEE